MASTPSKSTPAAKSTAGTSDNGPATSSEGPAPEPEAVKTTKKTPKPGEALAMNGAAPGALFLVSGVVSPDPAEVTGLLLEPGEVPRSFNVHVYDSAEDAAAATAEDAVERRAYSAHWPA